ncbi:MAG: hypothetical protein OEU68_07305 [Nitrospira sp.]|nr:hypothetical protein [Nitrospira sp.]MDH4245038.1 hypothetical protein [Nitrospira sp.]MDH4355957.1 hypothetical protein [Nitrospira sp.]MDH5319369.1 hypothetical protein [Nitrospira sp.]
MRRSLWVLLVSVVVSVGGLGAAPVSAQEGSITVNVAYQHDGPYAGKRVRATCAVNLRGPQDVQVTRCKMRVEAPAREGGFTPLLTLEDRQARVAVVGGQVLRLVIGGVSPVPSDPQATSKHPFFAVELLFHQPRPRLHDGGTALPGSQSGPKATLVSVSLDGTFQDNPDCLIFDIVGADVYDD